MDFCIPIGKFLDCLFADNSELHNNSVCIHRCPAKKKLVVCAGAYSPVFITVTKMEFWFSSRFAECSSDFCHIWIVLLQTILAECTPPTLEERDWMYASINLHLIERLQLECGRTCNRPGGQLYIAAGHPGYTPFRAQREFDSAR